MVPPSPTVPRFEYNPETDAWARVAEMPTPRAASGVAVVGTKIYVIGGISGNTNYASAEVFDTETRQWTRLPDMPTARDHLTAQAVRGRIYAIGGRLGRGQDTRVNEELDPVVPAWRTREPSPFRAEGMGSGVIGDRIVLTGVGDGFRATVDYDPAMDQWQTLAPMSAPRNGWYGSGAVIDNRLYLPAGGPEPGNSYSRTFDMFVARPVSAPRVLAIRHGATLQPEVAPGTVVSLFGESLTQGVRSTSAAADQLNGTSVRVGNRQAPILFASERQLNLLLLADLPVGETEVEVSHAGLRSAAVSLMVQAAAPGVFTLDGSGTGPGIATIAGTLQVAQPPPSGRPARVGEVLELYGTGFGRQGTTVELGRVPVAVVEVADVPGHLSLQVIRFTVPREAPAGDAVRVECRANGVPANAITISIAN